MIKIQLNRNDLTYIISAYDKNRIVPVDTYSEIVFGIVEYDFILPGRKKLLTEANRFTFSLRRHQLAALIQFFSALPPMGPYESVRVYNILDQAMRKV